MALFWRQKVRQQALEGHGWSLLEPGTFSCIWSISFTACLCVVSFSVWTLEVKALWILCWCSRFGVWVTLAQRLSQEQQAGLVLGHLCLQHPHVLHVSFFGGVATPWKAQMRTKNATKTVSEKLYIVYQGSYKIIVAQQSDQCFIFHVSIFRFFRHFD